MSDKVVRSISKLPLCGIYQILNKLDGKIYIGQSIDIERRWNQHRYGKGSLILRNAINKYGVEHFEFKIIEEINIISKTEKEIQDLLVTLEQKWLDSKKPFLKENGYNIQSEAKPNIPIKRSEGYGALISKIKIDNNHCGKTTIQYNLNGEFIKKWKSAAAIERELGFKAENISACNLRKAKTSNGYIWRFEGDTVSKYDIKNLKIKLGSLKPINQMSFDGQIINTFDSLTEASKHTGVHYTNISKVCSKKQKSAGGFKWEYI